MGLTRKTFFCAFWGCLLFHFSFGSQFEDGNSKALQDGVSEQRGRHRLQLLFPLLLRISTRLATLVPTALMGLLGIIAFVVFSKKALIISLFALFLTLSGKYNSKTDDVYIHKVNSYPEYNDEEHIHYHHQGPPKYKQVYYGGHPPKLGGKFIKRTDPKRISWHCHDDVQPYKPLSGFEKFLNIMDDNSVPDHIFDDEWNRKRHLKLCHF